MACTFDMGGKQGIALIAVRSTNLLRGRMCAFRSLFEPHPPQVVCMTLNP